MTATINTNTGIVINGKTWSVFGVFGDQVGVHADGISQNLRMDHIQENIASGLWSVVAVCEFCGSANIQTFDLHASGILCQCADCLGITSEGLDRGLFDTLFRTSGVPASDSVQSFRVMVRASGGYERMRGMARGGVIFQWG